MAKIIGVGHCVPDRIIKNEEISDNPQWVAKNTGILERHVVSMGESSSGLATVAGMKALQRAGIKDIDVLIIATTTPDMKAPSTACIVKKRLNLTGAAFDINAVCSGFLYGMVLGYSLIESGADNVMVIGVDTFSLITDYSKRDCVFFGDGAGAVVLTKGSNIKSMFMGAESADNAFLCEHDKYFVMDGKGVYNKALELLPAAINHVLKTAEMTLEDITWMVPHQPSIRILNDVADKIGFPREKVLMNMDRYANTSAGTIPILLSEKWDSFNKGDNLLFAAIGAGWTYGAIIYEV